MTTRFLGATSTARWLPSWQIGSIFQQSTKSCVLRKNQYIWKKKQAAEPNHCESRDFLLASKISLYIWMPGGKFWMPKSNLRNMVTHQTELSMFFSQRFAREYLEEIADLQKETTWSWTSCEAARAAARRGRTSREKKNFTTRWARDGCHSIGRRNPMKTSGRARPMQVRPGRSSATRRSWCTCIRSETGSRVRATSRSTAVSSNRTPGCSSSILGDLFYRYTSEGYFVPLSP